MMFLNRADAGQKLAQKLLKYRESSDIVVIGLPRGGVVVAAAVAAALDAPLDIIVPRKIGYPGNPELAIGAISEEGEGVFTPSLLKTVSEEYLHAEVRKEIMEAARRLRVYRGDQPPLFLKNKVALLVDDGIATGATMRAAILSARKKGAAQIVVAAPVIAPDTLDQLRQEAEAVVYLVAPESFGAVGAFYHSFEQTSDEEVIRLLQKSPPQS